MPNRIVLSKQTQQHNWFEKQQQTIDGTVIICLQKCFPAYQQGCNEIFILRCSIHHYRKNFIHVYVQLVYNMYYFYQFIHFFYHTINQLALNLTSDVDIDVTCVLYKCRAVDPSIIFDKLVDVEL